MIYNRYIRFRLRYNNLYWFFSNLRHSTYFLLAGFIVLADQISKKLVVLNIPLHTKVWDFGGDFFELIHVRNLGMAFSIGFQLTGGIKIIIAIIIPLTVLIGLVVYTLHSRELSNLQRWLVSGIIGGGLGNLIDRIFRRDGVVDFLSFKFYGLFGMERWPTFNIADIGIVVSTFLLVISMMIHEYRTHKH